MKLDEFATETYVRRPFKVQAFEITQDNIAELAPFVGELCDDNGTPFIKSDKKKVGNNFKVWPGFFATVLKGHVRCYSRKTFFEQFGELNDRTAPVVEFLHGRLTYEELGLAVAPVIDSEPVVECLDEEATIAETGSFPALEEPAEAPEEPVAAVEAEEGPRCEHGTPLTQECAYKKCEGGDVVDEEERDTSNDARDLSEWMGTDEEVAARHGGADLDDVPGPAEEPSAVEKYRSALEGVIKS